MGEGLIPAQRNRLLRSVGLGVYAALFVCTSACDILYGVRRSAPIYNDPSPQCVEQVLHGMPEISTVRHEQVLGGRPITWWGLHEPDVIQHFFYQGPNHIIGVLQYSKDYKGNMSLWQSNIDFNRVPPQEDVTATRPVMKHIETALEAQCGLSHLTSKITEWCHKEECPPIP